MRRHATRRNLIFFYIYAKEMAFEVDFSSSRADTIKLNDQHNAIKLSFATANYFEQKAENEAHLELRWCKNDSLQSKKSSFEIASLFHHLYDEVKSAAILKLGFFTE